MSDSLEPHLTAARRAREAQDAAPHGYCGCGCGWPCAVPSPVTEDALGELRRACVEGRDALRAAWAAVAAAERGVELAEWAYGVAWVPARSAVVDWSDLGVDADWREGYAATAGARERRERARDAQRAAVVAGQERSELLGQAMAQHRHERWVARGGESRRGPYRPLPPRDDRGCWGSR